MYNTCDVVECVQCISSECRSLLGEVCDKFVYRQNGSASRARKHPDILSKNTSSLTPLLKGVHKIFCAASGVSIGIRNDAVYIIALYSFLL